MGVVLSRAHVPKVKYLFLLCCCGGHLFGPTVLDIVPLSGERAF